MKMVDDQLSVREGLPHSRGKRGTHIQAHRFHSLGVGEPFQEGNHLLQLASFLHLQNPSMFQITEDGGISVPFSDRKLIDSQVLGSRQWPLLVETQTTLDQSRADQISVTLTSKPRANPHLLADLRHRLRADLFSNPLTQPPGGSAARTTCCIWLRKGAVAP